MKSKFNIGYLFLVLFCSLFVVSCYKDDEAPAGAVDMTIDLYNVSNVPLRTVGAYLDYPAGYKGVVVFNFNGTEFLAYEQACPKDHDEAVKVDASGIKLICPKCASEFEYLSGSVIKGPARAGLRSYPTYYDGVRYVRVYN